MSSLTKRDLDFIYVLLQINLDQSGLKEEYKIMVKGTISRVEDELKKHILEMIE